ncbi:type IV pilin protein [Aquabacterium sp. J223]|uniref:type IV pilin protein n=1 Tax=Aquabacterium sp. J223 TaxID=2898431 RepID=UPI0021AE281F|nr:type IV pilin protein [Aquabacterium sp. J223]UUX94600.1 prepilin-type N-terminal cleavage/methylation domain-containing protein [Aquabacterium sp. J223]
MPLPTDRAAARRRGFTLIELMLVIVVLGVLGLVALPSYRDAVVRSRRADGVAALTAVQQAQERWRSNHPSFTTSLADLRLASTSPSGHYVIDIPSANGRTYQLRATATGGQTADADCKTLLLKFDENLCVDGVCHGMATEHKAITAAGVEYPAPRCWNR